MSSNPLVKAAIDVPKEVYINGMPGPRPRRPMPVRIPVSVIMVNGSRSTAHLQVPTPCDVHQWEIRDSKGNVVAAKHDEICLDVIAKYDLPPTEPDLHNALREHAVIAVDPGVLRLDEEYEVLYWFWGHECGGQRKFTVRIAQLFVEMQDTLKSLVAAAKT